jgi:hypothetical protein
MSTNPLLKLAVKRRLSSMSELEKEALLGKLIQGTMQAPGYVSGLMSRPGQGMLSKGLGKVKKWGQGLASSAQEGYATGKLKGLVGTGKLKPSAPHVNPDVVAGASRATAPAALTVASDRTRNAAARLKQMQQKATAGAAPATPMEQQIHQMRQTGASGASAGSEADMINKLRQQQAVPHGPPASKAAPPFQPTTPPPQPPAQPAPQTPPSPQGGGMGSMMGGIGSVATPAMVAGSMMLPQGSTPQPQMSPYAHTPININTPPHPWYAR